MDILHNLNKEQREAVTHTEGPLLILAGAGSGKTRVLTHRIAYLVEEMGVSPDEILAITFTNKAAQEMKDRVTAFLKVPGYKMWISTFHAASVRFLRAYGTRIGLSKSFTISDASEQLALIRQCIKDMNLNDRDYPPAGVLARISAAKNQLIDQESFAKTARGFREERIGRLYTRYQRILEQNHTMDFDDIIMKTVHLFRSQPDVLAYYQDQFRYILVDEYQDTNYAQYMLVRLLSAKHGNLCVVGDDNQSIYGWRGADISNILNFERDFPNAKVVKLEQNYRSTQIILDAANHLVRNNQTQKEKNLWTNNPKGQQIICKELVDEHHEAMYVTDEIQRMNRLNGHPLDSFVVLYRTNAQSRVFEDLMMQKGMPYKIVGGFKFYQRKEIKDIIAYLRVILNPEDALSIERVINVPKRGVGAVTLEKIRGFAILSKQSLFEALERVDEIEGLTPRLKTKIKGLVNLIQKCRQNIDQQSISDIVRAVAIDSGMISELEAEGTPEALSRLENIREFFGVADEFASSEISQNLEDFLASIALISEVDTMEQGEAVTLMTFHSAKGLEFPVVFMAGMEEGVFPHSRSLENEEEMEEERRLCYVGITRAQECLYLTHTYRRALYGQSMNYPPSRFISEIPDHLMDVSGGTSQTGRMQHTPQKAQGRLPPVKEKLAPVESTDYGLGEKITHSIWGPGIIIGLKPAGDDIELTVSFQSTGIKKLSARFAPLKRES